MSLLPQCRLAVESLESRELFAADVSLLSGGVLSIEGTEDSDVVQVEVSRGDVVVTAAAGFEESVTRLPLSDVSEIYFAGNAGDDVFVNSSRLPVIAYGNQGNDRLVGGKSDDELFGGPGDDQLDGQDGNDTLHGDYGDDILIGGRGNDDLRGWYGDDTLRGGSGNDYLSGYKGNDFLDGESGNDTLKGHEGDDYLDGGSGNDKLYGWKGNDVMRGGQGNDYLSGWSGDDILIGGDGKDRLRGHAGSDILIGGRSADELDGGSGEDLNISGYTTFENNDEELTSILSVWAGEGSVDERTHRLFEGESVLVPVNFTTVRNDFAVDTFFDDRSELDWFLYESWDRFKDE